MKKLKKLTGLINQRINGNEDTETKKLKKQIQSRIPSIANTIRKLIVKKQKFDFTFAKNTKKSNPYLRSNSSRKVRKISSHLTFRNISIKDKQYKTLIEPCLSRGIENDYIIRRNSETSLELNLVKKESNNQILVKELYHIEDLIKKL